MLDWIAFVQRDSSAQKLKSFTINVTGDLLDLPAGPLAFAAGAEQRSQSGRFDPDPVVAAGDTAGLPAQPTAGGFDVAALYGEVDVPLVADVPMGDLVDLSAAVRYFDTKSFDSGLTSKVGLRWRPVGALLLRATWAQGYRAPNIGELFGGAAREDFTFQDPCSDVLGLVGSANGGRDTPAPANIMSNCAALGVPTGSVQPNPSLNAISAGNADLDPETSDSFTVGAVWSSSFDTDWIARLTAAFDY